MTNASLSFSAIFLKPEPVAEYVGTSWITFSGRVELPAELAYSWFFSFTVRFCPSIATWSDKVEDLKLAVPSIKVMFVWGISFSFCSCDLKIVKIIFCHGLNLLPKARETFFFICWLSSLLGLFCPFQFRQYWFQLSKGKRKFTTTF